MKGCFKLIFSGLIFLLLTGCFSSEKRVGIFLYNGEDPFVAALSEEIALQLEGTVYRLEVYDAQNSQVVQNEQLEKMLRDPVDLAVINPVDRLGAYAIIRKFREEDIPVIFFNRQPMKKDLALWDRCFYVGATAEQSGQMQAGLVMELFGNDPDHLNRYDRNGDGVLQSIIIRGEQSHQDSEIRTREVKRTLIAGSYSFELLTSVIADWSRKEAYEKMDDVLNLHGDELEVVFSNNDEMALGAIERMGERGFFADDDGNGRTDRRDASWIPVLGIDGLPEAIDSIEEGRLYGTVINDEKAQARAIVDLAGTLLSGRSPEEGSYELEDEKFIWSDYYPYLSR
ncbi:MAG: galactose ABC transporter substrate-binding protein [Spirochaetales bacterium]|nr:galactose ABC transporter substrate-binding protein [Spirochaetales bacterium]